MTIKFTLRSLCFIFCLFLFFRGDVFAQLLTWESKNLTGLETSYLSSGNDPNIAPATIIRGSGIVPGSNANRINATGFAVAYSASDSNYFEFTIDPDPGFVFSVTNITFNYDHSASGPASLLVTTSLDNYVAVSGSFTNLPASISTGNVMAISGVINISSPVTFRIHGYDATGSGGSGGFENSTTLVGPDLIINGSSGCFGMDVSPIVPPDSVTFQNISFDSLTVLFKKGDGVKRIIIAQLDSPVTAVPVDSTVYNANPIFGNGTAIEPGQFVVYADTGASFNLTGLEPNSTYYFAIFEFNDTLGCPNYLIPGGAGAISVTTVAAPTCAEIRSILVNACGNPEEDNEMFTFKLGSFDVDTSEISVDWPSASSTIKWRGVCQDASTAQKVAALRKTIIDTCARLLEPVNGIIPAGANVILVGSMDMDTLANSFANLHDTLYIIFQCPGNSSAHFLNNSCACERTLGLNISGITDCTDSVTYEPDSLLKQNGTLGSENGGAVAFDDAGNATYFNNGCNVPFDSMKVNAFYTTPTGGGNLCGSDTLTLMANTGGSYKTLLWFGGSGTFISPNSETTYYITSPSDTGLMDVFIRLTGSCNDTVIDTVQVNIIWPPDAPTINSSGFDTICEGSAIILTTTLTNNILWSTGDTIQSITIDSTGIYYVGETNLCYDSHSDSLFLEVQSGPVSQIENMGPLEFCLGNSVTLNGGNGSLLNWKWFKNGIEIAGQVDSLLIVNAPGSYTLEVDSGICQTLSVATNVIVNDLPDGTILPAGNLSTCSGINDTIFAVSDLSYTYQWFKNGVLIPSSDSSLLAINDSGNYYVSITDTNSCNSISAVKSVSINPKPSVLISTSDSLVFCQGDSVKLAATPDNNFIYGWKKDSSGITINTDSIHFANTSGTYFVEITDPNGCKDTSNSLNVTVKPNPTGTISPASLVSMCAGDSIDLAITGSGAALIQWKKNGIDVSGENDSIYLAKDSGDYSVLLILNGCTFETPATTVVITAPPVAAITPSPGPFSICPGDSLKLQGNSGAGFNYQWLKNNINIPGEDSIAFFANDSGSYSLNVSFASGCGTVSGGVLVNMNTPPVVIISTIDNEICMGDSTNLRVDKLNLDAYQWYLNDSIIPGATDTIINVKTGGIYSIKTDSSGCESTSQNLTIIVNSNPTGTISPAGPVSMCSGDSIDLAITGSGAALIQWKENGIDISGENDSIYLAKNSGDYSVLLILNGCAFETPATAVLITAPPIAAITPSPGPFYICPGDSIKLEGNGGVGFNYQWLKNNINIPGEDSIAFFANDSGSYSLNISFASGCGTVSGGVLVNINTPPQVAISTIDNEICIGDSTNLRVNKVNLDAYQWYLNDSLIIGATDTVLNVKAAGIYSIKTDSSGCESTSQNLTVIVNPNPTGIISPASPIQICQGSNDTISVPPNPSSNFQWYRNNILIPGEISSALVISTAGDYFVSFTDVNLCNGTSDTVTASVLSLTPLILPAGPITFCMGDSVILKTGNGTGFLFNWYRDGVIIPGATDSFFVAKNAGQYSVQLMVSGCSFSSSNTTASVTLNPDPTIEIFGPQKICPGSGTSLQGPVNINFAYQWNLNGNPVSGAVTSTLNVNVPGDYSLLVIQDGCDSLSQTIKIESDTLPVAKITNLDTLLCNGEEIMLQSIPSTGSYSYQWYRDGALLLNSSSGLLVNSKGAFRVVISNTCGKDTSEKTILMDSPLALFIADPQTGLPPLSVNFTNQSTGADLYSWNYGNNNSHNDKEPHGQKYETPGTYPVRLIVSTNSGCSDTMDIDIIVTEEDKNLIIPNVFSPNGDNSNDAFYITEDSISSFHIQIFNRWGKELFRSEDILYGWDGTTGAGEAPAGVYFYILRIEYLGGKDPINQGGFFNLVR